MNKKIFVIILFAFISSCKEKVSKQVEVYNNDFESNNLNGIVNAVTERYNGTTVLGRYNDAGFTLLVNNLPKHDMVIISFDLYLHDSWDGNKPAPDGPDFWQMFVDGNPYINTTFSNLPCGINEFCPPQSYPLDYPNSYNNPRTGAYRIDLPAACKTTYPNGTSLYKIVKTIRHSNSTLSLYCVDKLIQSNTPDPKCDESWSVDNVNIKAINL